MLKAVMFSLPVKLLLFQWCTYSEQHQLRRLVDSGSQINRNFSKVEHF